MARRVAIELSQREAASGPILSTKFRSRTLSFSCMWGWLVSCLALLVLAQDSATSVVEEAYPDGKRKSRCEMRLDDRGDLVPHGKYESWYPGGRIQSRGRYIDGHRDGAWKYFDEQKRESTVEYQFHRLTDEARGWTWEGESADGWKQGCWNLLRRDGTLAFTGNYDKGTAAGLWKFFHADGVYDRGWLSGEYRASTRVKPPSEVLESSEATTGEGTLASRRLPAPEVDPGALALLEEFLGGGDGARPALLARPRDAFAAALALLVTLEVADPRDAEIARKLDAEILGRICGGTPAWTESVEANLELVRRWHSLWELVQYEEELWRTFLDPKLHWIDCALQDSLFGRPPLPRGFDEATPPDARVKVETRTLYASRSTPAAHPPARPHQIVAAPLALALEWLTSRQADDGSWDAGEPRLRVLATAECVLVLFGEGGEQTLADSLSTSRAEVILQGLRWLVLAQDPQTGRIGTGADAIYEHACATEALASVAFVLHLPSLRTAVGRAMRFLQDHRLPDGSWPIRLLDSEGDAVSTAQAARALFWAAVPEVDEVILPAAEKWLHEHCAPDTSFEAARGTVDPDLLAARDRETASVIAALARVFINPTADTVRATTNLAPMIIASLPKPYLRGSIGSPEFQEAASYLVFQWDGTEWDRWEPAMRSCLLDAQLASGELAGSWNPPDSYLGGRILATARWASTLEVYLRFNRILARAR